MQIHRPNKGLSEAKRSAEALFEARSVAEIREIEGRTRKDIDLKKHQLRQLVGDSYRDLIGSADRIVSIARDCGATLDNIKAIQQGFSSLVHSFTTSDDQLHEKRDSFTKHEELIGMGSRVRYLVDTPEMIWGCLDTQQHLDAARRFLRAQHVHQLLLDTYSRDQLARFPLLNHQWPLVLKFKQQVEDAALAGLASQSALATPMAADALATVCALRGWDSQAALAQLLASRRTWLVGLLQGQLGQQAGATQPQVASEGQGDAHAVASLLTEFVCALQTTISQVGELFLASPPPPTPPATTSSLHHSSSQSLKTQVSGVDAAAGAAGSSSLLSSSSCLLQHSALEDDMDASELLFGGHHTSAAATLAAGSQQGQNQGAELLAWRKANKAMQERLLALPSGAVELACSSWLRDVASDTASQCPHLLSACTSAQHLVSVEAAVRSAIATWRAPGPSTAQQAGTSLLTPAPSALATAPSVSSASAGLTKASSGAAWLTPHSAAAAAASEVLKQAELRGGSSGPLRSASSNLAGGLGGADQAHGGVWDAVCDRVMGTRLQLWQEVLHAPFIVRAKQLIAGAFTAVAAAVEVPLQKAMAAAEAAVPEAPGQASCPCWPLLPRQELQLPIPQQQQQQQQAGGAARVGFSEGSEVGGREGGVSGREGVGSRPWSERVHSTGRANKSEGAVSDKAFRVSVHAMRHAFDAALSSVLQSTMLLLDAPAPTHAAYTTQHSTLPLTPAPRRVGRDTARAAELEPFVQQQCTELTATLAATLSSLLADTASAQPLPAGADGAPAAEKVLLLGRLASALATDSRYLAVLLGPPDAWRGAAGAIPGSSPAATAPRNTAMRSNAASGRPGAAGAATAPRLAAAMAAFRAVAVAAYRKWAAWAAAGLVASHRAALMADDTLTSHSTPLSWQEVVLSSSPAPTSTSTSTYDSLLDGDSLGLGLPGDSLPDMRFSLPACPTAATLGLLAAACQEVQRAGDHAAAPEALQVWEWELGGALLASLTQIVQQQAHTSSSLLTPQQQQAAGSRTSSLLNAAWLGHGEGVGGGYSAGAELHSSAAGFSGRLSEKGVLQLLLDVRLARDMLAGGRPLCLGPTTAAHAVLSSSSSSSSGRQAAQGGKGPEQQQQQQQQQQEVLDPGSPLVVATVAERRRAAVLLEQQLQDMLDPIDWATYEPHLWAHAKRYYQRTAVLFGAVTQLQRLHPDGGAGIPTAPGSSRATAGAGAVGVGGAVLEFNPLNILPVAPRFHYLPISTPISTLAGAAAGGKGRQGSATFLTPLAGSASDLASAYSFADLGSAGRRPLSPAPQGSVGLAAASHASAASEGAAAAGGFAAGASALGALQARLQQQAGSLGSLGSILGDKAAEMTAMAQQRFGDSGIVSHLGDILGGAGGLGSATTGLLSSFAKGVAAGNR